MRKIEKSLLSKEIRTERDSISSVGRARSSATGLYKGEKERGAGRHTWVKERRKLGESELFRKIPSPRGGSNGTMHEEGRGRITR